eukprot:8787282-Lingulodinium_polyedra.AAC.1
MVLRRGCRRRSGFACWYFPGVAPAVWRQASCSPTSRVVVAPRFASKVDLKRSVRQSCFCKVAAPLVVAESAASRIANA